MFRCAGVGIALTVLVAGACCPAAFAQGANRQQPPQQGQLDASESLFVVLAAINAAGYDYESDSPTNSPLRAAVKAEVLKRNPPSLARLRNFYEARKKWSGSAELSQYISYALSVSGPPDFKPKFSPNQMPPDSVALEGLSSILVDFYREARMDELWRAAQPAFDEAIAKYHAPVTETVFQANMYMRNPTSGVSGRRFQVLIDLLGAPNQAHARSFGDEYSVVVTPSAELRVRDIRHAYLHYVLDPVCIRNAAHFEPKKGLGDLSHGSPILDEAYKNDFVLLSSMCLVKAVEARMDRSLGQAFVRESMSEGFIMTAYFYEGLLKYEKQETALRLYLPEMVDAIDLKREDERIARVKFATERATRTVKTVEPVAPKLSEPETLIAQGEELYKQRQFPEAQAAFRKSIAMAAAPNVHAKAYYGLARIAALEKRPGDAHQLFEKTLELKPDAFERAWAHVYLANLEMAAEYPDVEAATKQYQAALAVEGSSEAARNAAQQGLARIAALSEKN